MEKELIEIKGEIIFQIEEAKEISMTLVSNQIHEGSYSYFKLQDKILPIDPITIGYEFEGEGEEGEIDDKEFSVSDNEISRLDSKRVLGGYDYDAYSNLYFKFGPNFDVTEDKKFKVKLSLPEGTCLKLKQSEFEFSVLKGNLAKYEFKDKLALVDTLNVSEGSNLVLKVEVNLPKTPAVVKCGSYVDYSFNDNEIFNQKKDLSLEKLFYKNYYANSAAVLDLLLPQGVFKQKFGVKCFVYSPSLESEKIEDSVSFILGKRFTSDYPQELEPKKQGYFVPKSIKYSLKNKLSTDIEQELREKLVPLLIKKLCNIDTKKTQLPEDFGCFKVSCGKG